MTSWANTNLLLALRGVGKGIELNKDLRPFEGGLWDHHLHFRVHFKSYIVPLTWTPGLQSLFKPHVQLTNILLRNFLVLQ